MRKIIRTSVNLNLELTDEEQFFQYKFNLSDFGSNESLQCTICSKITYGKIYPHPVLRVVVCLDCSSKYNNHEFRSYINADDTMCRWCMKSAMDYNCAICTCLFCNECLDRNFGPNYYQENWQCFICNPKQLWRLRAICTRAMDRPRSKMIKSIVTENTLNNNQPLQITENNNKVESPPTNDQEKENETNLPQECSSAACDIITEVKKDVDYFIHLFKTQFDKFYNRCSKLEFNKTGENVERNREKISKFFNDATTNLEFIKMKTNLRFCDWQKKVPKINGLFAKEMEAAQQLEYKLLSKEKEHTGDLIECQNEELVLNSNIASPAKRKTRKKIDLRLHPRKKYKTDNHSEKLSEDEDITRIDLDKSSDGSLDLLTEQYQNNQSTSHSQSKDVSDKNDHINVKSEENIHFDLKKLDNVENLAKSPESNPSESTESNLGSSDQALQNNSQDSQKDLRANKILELITSSQFTDLKNVDILTKSPDVQSSDEKLYNYQTKPQVNGKNLQSHNDSLQSSEILSNDLTKPYEKRNDASNMLTDAQSTKSSTRETDSSSQLNIQSANPSGLLELSEIKVEPDEYAFASNLSVDTVILSELEDLDNMITIQQNLCERTGTFYQSYSVGNDHIDLMIDGNEQVSENRTEGEDYDAILENVLEQQGFETNTEEFIELLMKEKAEETKKSTDPKINNKETQVDTEAKKIEEEYQIALQTDVLPAIQSQLSEPKTKETIMEKEPNVEIKEELLSQSLIATQLLSQPVIKQEFYENEMKLEDLSLESIVIKADIDLQNLSDTGTGIDTHFETDMESVFETDDTDNEEKEEAYRRLYRDTSDECNNLSSSGSSVLYATQSSQSSVSEIEIVLDPRQRSSDTDDNFNTSTEDEMFSTPVQSDPKLLQQCRIQLVKSKEDLEIERLLNLKTLDKTTRPYSESSDGSIKCIQKKSKKNLIDDDDDSDSDTVSLTSDISDDPKNAQDASDINSITKSPLSKEFLEDDTDAEDDFSPDLPENEPVKKPKIAKQISEETKIISDNEIDPKSEWKKDRLLTGALNNDDSDATDCSVANDLLAKSQGNKHKKKSPEINDSDSSDCFVIGNPKKRRISSNDSETDMSSDDSDVQYLGTDDSATVKPRNKGRHNIREVLPDSLLEAETQKADKEEAERRKRIDQKNKSLEVVLSQSSFPKDEPKLVLDWDDVLKEPLVSVNPLLIPILKPHQISGIKFMWDNCFESVARLKDSKGAGCILAHCMGLGKTMQVVVLAHTILTHPVTKVKHILVLCPLSTVSNWCNEFKITLKNVADKLKIYFITSDRYKSFSRKVHEVKQWRKTGGVLIISYDTFKSIIDTKRNNMATYKVALEEALLEPGPDLVVCDEGHILKSGKTNIFMSLKKVKTARRIILTGTPMQNNLKEYYYMVNFVKPSLLGTFKEYTRCFINPIENGQYEDSSKSDINLMRKRSHVLHKKLETTVQRYEVKELSPYLPKKNDHVLFLQLSPAQQKLYNIYLELRENISYKKMLFQDFHHLQNIWTHPAMLQLKLNRKEKDEKLKINHITTAKNNLTDDLIVFKEPDFDGPMTLPFHWFKDHIPDDVMTNLEHGPKVTLLFSIIRECETIGEKLLIFSSSLIELDLIEHFLNQTRMMDGQFWRKKQNYFRMDGTVMSEERSQYCESFNNKHNKRIKLFLVSHKVGGLGLNLIAASRVVLMDVSWNPAYDSQSVFRVYRFGQERECYIYRLVAMGTMEEVVYSRAVTKLAVSCRVVDEQQISRHFKSDELTRMYKLNLDFMNKRPTPTLPPDRLLAKLWVTHNPILHNFCDHESLLQNQTHEELNEEEMKNAWDEYQQEEEFARERARAMQDPFPPTSGFINNSFNGVPISPYPFMNNTIPISNPNYTSQLQQNNPAQNILSYNTSSSHINPPKMYSNSATINGSSTNPQFHYNNSTQNIPTFNTSLSNSNSSQNYINPPQSNTYSTTKPHFQYNKPTINNPNSYTHPKRYDNPVIDIPTSRSTNPQSQPNQIKPNTPTNTNDAHTNNQYNNMASNIASSINRIQFQNNKIPSNVLSSHAKYARANLHNPYNKPVSNNSPSTSAKLPQQNIPSNNTYPVIRFKKPNPFAPVAIGNSNLQNVPSLNNIRPNPLDQQNQNIATSKSPIVSNQYKKPAPATNSTKLSEITTSANVMNLSNFPKINEMLSLSKQTSLINNGISFSVINDERKETTNGNDAPKVTRNRSIRTDIEDIQLPRINQDPNNDIL